jgi:hypothetical protein
MVRKSRQRENDIAFGSDSFLDVLANIVGILIILIVVVGLRVRSAPVAHNALDPTDEDGVRQRQAQRAQWDDQRAWIDAENERRRLAYLETVRAREAELERRRAMEAEISRQRAAAERSLAERRTEIAARQQRTADNERRAKRLEDDIADLETELQAATGQLQMHRSEHARRRAELAANEALLEQLTQRSAAEQQAIEQTQRRWQALDARAAEISRETAVRKARQPAPEEWKHVFTPIAQRVRKREIHFRCLNRRISDTHFEDLVQLVRQRVTTRLRNAPTVGEEVVGPIGGFRLRYRVGRSTASFSQLAADPFSSGYILAGWQLIADSDQLGETEREALSPNSKLATALESYPPEDNVITLWVYPDSFDLSKSVAANLHARGYSVALRPLPFGFPIAGSVHGTASLGQ